MRNLDNYEQNHYSLNRAIDLAERIARDFDTKLKKVVSERPLMSIPYADHEALQLEINKIEDQWKASILELKTAISRNSSSSNHRMTKGRDVEFKLKALAEDPVFKRLNNIIAFRSEHHKLESVISTTFAKQSEGQSRSEIRSQALNDIRDAFTTFVKSVDDMLDISKEGHEQWDTAKKAYELSTSKIESQLTTLLKKKLAKAVTANEMFQVFNDYNKLLMRPKIKGTVA